MKHLLPLMLAFCLQSSFAQFTIDTLQNTVVHNLPGSEQSVPLSVTTSDGKTYISWFDISSGSYVLRMQLLDAAGNAMWGPGGIVVSSYPQSTALFRYDLAIDNEDNAVVAFQDERSGDLRVVVYKLNTSGTQLWGSAGVALNDSTASGLGPRITVTGNNNVIVAWGASIGSSKWISFQKISPSGNILWSKRIIGTVKYSRAVMVPSGTDGFQMLYVQETGNFPGVSTMFAQRFDGNGNGIWPAPVQVSTKTIQFFFFPEIVSDGAGGFLIAFTGPNPSNPAQNDVFAQRVDSAGNKWNLTGNAAATQPGDIRMTGHFLRHAPTGQFFVTLQVTDPSQGQSGIALQGFDSAGNVLLGPNGILLKPVSATYHLPFGLADAGNGLICIYEEGSGFGTKLLKAFKTDYSGSLVWSYDPVVSNFPCNHDDLSTGRFRNNQVVFVWEDDRLNPGSDLGIYTQNMTGDGQFGNITGLENRPQPLSLQVFPNPGVNPSIVFSHPFAGTGLLRIFSTEGRLVYERDLQITAGDNRIQPIVELEEGLYQIEIVTPAGRSLGKWLNQYNR